MATTVPSLGSERLQYSSCVALCSPGCVVKEAQGALGEGRQGGPEGAPQDIAQHSIVYLQGPANGARGSSGVAAAELGGE